MATYMRRSLKSIVVSAIIIVAIIITIQYGMAIDTFIGNKKAANYLLITLISCEVLIGFLPITLKKGIREIAGETNRLQDIVVN